MNETGNILTAALITAISAAVVTILGAFVNSYLNIRKASDAERAERESRQVKGLVDLLEQHKKTIEQLDREYERRTASLRRERDRLTKQLITRLQDLASATERITLYEAMLEECKKSFTPWRPPSGYGSAADMDIIGEGSSKP